MPPRTRKAAPAAPPDLDGKQPANATSDLDALRTEVAAEPEGAGDGPKPVPLCDTTVQVKYFMDWPNSADEDLIAGRLTVWARKILDGDDFVTVWQPIDPTNRQVAAFITDVEKVFGIPLVSRVVSAGS